MKSTPIELRDYQLAAVDDVLNAYRNKVNCVVQLPTGTGKTTVIAEAVKRLVQNNPKFRVLIIVHRIELLDQISARLFQFGIANGKYPPEQLHVFIYRSSSAAIDLAA